MHAIRTLQIASEAERCDVETCTPTTQNLQRSTSGDRLDRRRGKDLGAYFECRIVIGDC